MAADNSEQFVLLNHLAEDFAARYRRGEHPSLQEYIDRHPELADDIREFFPALAVMEQIKDDRQVAVEQAASFALPPLERLGDFRIIREIGHGGMGVVYEAEQVSLGRHVALKVLPKQLLADARTKQRFEREARAAAKLHHTNIVPVFGVGEHDGLPYYAMQFIPGLGLDEVLEELQRLQPGKPGSGSTPGPTGGELRVARKDVSAAGVAQSLLTGRFTLAGEKAEDAPAARVDPTVVADQAPSVETPVAGRLSDTFSLSSSSVVLPGTGRQSGNKPLTYWQSVARIGVQVADALEYAHCQGILHRDIKPSNLLLDTSGTVWVTDFGLAKADDQQNLTHTGDIIGTLRYMPPEAFNGKTDARSDIYSLGLTLYELLALRPAFDEADRNKLVKQVMHDDSVRPRKVNAGVPRDLETLVLKAIARDPAHRYQTAGALADDLQRFLDGRPITARPVGHIERAVKWVKRNPVVTGAALAVVLALAVGTTVSYRKYLEAQKETDKATKAREFLASIFQKAERDEKGGNVTVRQLLDEAETRIPVEFADQPELRGDLLSTIGKVKRGIARRTPQAMILEARGTVRLQSAAGVMKAAVPQALVNLDDRLTLGADSQVQLVFLSDLHKERLKAGREVTIDTKGCEPADAVLDRDSSVLMTFVRLPKGTFYMGWDGPKKGVKTEIEEDFEIAVHDVTQGQWRAVMGTNPSHYSRKGTGRDNILDISDEELQLFPVEAVSWDDAEAFIKKLNEMERDRGYWYRLPTEAEWEYSCGGGATSEEECSYRFYFDEPANDLSSERANFNGDYPCGNAPKGKRLGRPTRVGAYPPNKLGLCDMHGNVWQWCADLHSPGGSDRVIRGGSWSRNGSDCDCRAAHRYGSAPTGRFNDHGFRLARVPRPAPGPRNSLSPAVPAGSKDKDAYRPPKGYVAYRANQPIRLDGKLDDEAWKAAPWTDDFVDIEGDFRSKPRYRTRVKMLWDDQYLYLGAELEEPHVQGTYTKRDSYIFHEDNAFNVFINPDGNNHNYAQLEMNALNAVWDLRLKKPYRDGGQAEDEWDIPGLRTAVHVNGTINDPRDTDKTWACEIAIPWEIVSALNDRPGNAPRDGDQWRINFSRAQWRYDIVDGKYVRDKDRREDNWAWSPQGVVDMHRPELWGYVQFSTAASGKAAFRPDAAGPAKHVLHRIYSAQVAFHKVHQRYAESLQELGLAGLSHNSLAAPPVIEVSDDGYRAMVELRLPDGASRRWRIRQDSLVGPVAEQ
jgi:serine/threonine protein kinase/formylglycine-generating enzyme required for sulfatase activity